MANKAFVAAAGRTGLPASPDAPQPVLTNGRIPNPLRLIFGIIFTLLAVFVSAVGAQPQIDSFLTGNGYDRIEKDYLGTQFNKGDTNTPMLAMDWFMNANAVFECRVSRTGNARDVLDVINWAFQGSHWKQLDQTNLNLLIETINNLPSPPKAAPPRERWLVVRGIRHEQWFKQIYDRANVPPEVEKLYALTGAHLEWFIPQTEGRPITTNLHIDYFYVARNAPMAVGFAATNILIVDVNKKTVQKIVPVDVIRLHQQHEYGQDVAISPDGKILFKSLSDGWNDHGICAVDLTTQKVLWKKDSLEHAGDSVSHVIVGGDRGQYLFACGAHTIERWDLATGKRLAVLATNQALVKWVEVSQNGKVFAAGFYSRGQAMPEAFTIWRADEDQPAAHLDNIGTASACLSPDGRILALNVFGKHVIEMRDWEHGLTKEVPLRFPYASHWASQMFWSPKGNFLAARIHSPLDTMVVYETETWKPLAQLPVAESGFDSNGNFLQLIKGNVFSLEPAMLETLGKQNGK